MVQRKEPETRRSQHVKLERQSSCQQQQDNNLKQKMKLERSIRAADLESLQDCPPMKSKKRSLAARGSPNYMKPTSSSDAKKEQLQVTPHSKTPADKKRSPKNSKKSISSRASSPLSVSLSRQSSLKAIRPLIKKSLIKGVVMNRATCSSTLKDLRFPEALDLNPGGTEAEGTSVMRVCPYTYCSLNGHRHEPLPPLKCFMSARRKLLRTQKSLKLKGLNPLRAKVLVKDKGGIDTGLKATSKVRSGLEVTPPMEEEPDDDFFVEIYTTSNPEEQVINEIVEDGVDRSSEVSNEAHDEMINFLEYVECDQQVEEAEEEKRPSLVPEENEELGTEGYEVELLEKAEDGMVESESKVSSTFDFYWEEEGSPFPDNITECSECPEDCSDLMPPQAESSISDGDEANTEQQQEVNQEAAEDSDAISSCGELSTEPVPVNESTVDEAAAEWKQEVYQKVAEIDEAMAPDDRNLEGNDTKSCGEELRRDDVLDQEPESSENEDENEVSGTNLLSMVQLINSSDGHEESDQGMTEDERIRIQQQLVIECDDATEDASSSSNIQSCSSNDQSDESDTGESWESDNEQEEIGPLEGTVTKPKAIKRVTRKKIIDEPDNLREFNPRAPNFLDVEPDPEAERVDLRHQLMDERKNAEEYLIDYALRRAVTKLAPDRKKKVALLVEAFETVKPLPVYEKPLRRGVPDFTVTRMQACS